MSDSETTAQIAKLATAKAEEKETIDPIDAEESKSTEKEPVKKEEPVSDLDEDIAHLKVQKKSHQETEDKDQEEDKEQQEEQESANPPVDNAAIDSSESAEKRKQTFEEKFEQVMKKPTKRRKKNEVDLEAMQDEAISELKNAMKDAAYDDIECVNNHEPATHKLRLLSRVKKTLLKSNLYDSILDNNMLEAVRIWLEPLPDGSLPSYEIQKTLLSELKKLPIKTIHLRESGLGKVMIFYQKSPIVDPVLKRMAERMISEWTRPIMGRSDSYRARRVPKASFNPEKFIAQQRLQTTHASDKHQRKTLYQESADRRKRAAAPEQATKVYTIAPKMNAEAFHRSKRSNIAAMGIGSSLSKDERFKKLSQKLTQMSQKHGGAKKGGVSIEGKGVNGF